MTADQYPLGITPRRLRAFADEHIAALCASSATVQIWTDWQSPPGWMIVGDPPGQLLALRGGQLCLAPMTDQDADHLAVFVERPTIRGRSILVFAWWPQWQCVGSYFGARWPSQVLQMLAWFA